jgi:hypothetical protein
LKRCDPLLDLTTLDFSRCVCGPRLGDRFEGRPPFRRNLPNAFGSAAEITRDSSEIGGRFVSRTAFFSDG